ncbi:hypothetical protein AgCh_007470 [Apium graveolens]
MLDASLPPNKEPLPDCRTGDPKFLGAKCRILRSLPTRTPVDYRDRAPKAHTIIYPTSPMRTLIDYRRRPSIRAYPRRHQYPGSDQLTRLLPEQEKDFPNKWDVRMKTGNVKEGEFLNILEEIIGYLEFSIMVNESEVIVGGGSSSGVTAGAIDWTTYSFPQDVELTGLPEKFNDGIGFSRWQKRMKLWLTIKGLWPVVEYEKPVVDQEKADTVNAFAMWAEKDGVARAAILAALTNTLFDVYSSDAYSAKLLWEKLDQTHNTDSQGLEKYSVARFLEFKLVDNKSMTVFY